MEDLRRIIGSAGCIALLACSSNSSPPRGAADGAPQATTDAAVVDGPPAVHADASVADASPDAPVGDYIVPPAASCAPTQSACAVTAAPATIAATYRKDAYLSESQYNEYPDPPLNGGRVHIAAVAAVTGRVTRVVIDGVDADSIYTENPGQPPAFEWYHVWPRDPVAGEPIWVAFHSRAAAWDTKVTATLRVETDAGVAVDGSFAVAQTTAPLTYVTFDDDLQTALLHVTNRGNAPRTIDRVVWRGKDVTAAACIGTPTLQPGETALVTVPLCQPAVPGEAWTAVVRYADGGEAVGVGRVLRSRFPIWAWQNTSECPFPTGNASNYQSLRDAAFDSIYVHGGMCTPQACGCDMFQLLNEQLPAIGDWYALANAHNVLEFTTPLPDTSALIGAMTGDESDGQIYDEDTGVPNAARKADMSRRLWLRHPELTTFNGAKTNKHVGSFAGMSDVQGVDLYVAACAPHITQWGNHPPLRGAYDYLRNTRDNHMPLPTWLYAQGLAPVWNQDDLAGNEVHVQPDAQEILIQAMSAVAAGAKGLLWFQANQNEAAHAPQRWAAIARANRMIRAVRPQLRTGDITGMIEFGGGVIAEAIRSPRAIVVPIINLNASETVDDIACAAAFVSGQFPHWVLADHSAAVSVTVPRDFGAVDVFEVTGDAVVDAPAYAVNGRSLSFGNVMLSNDVPVRLLVIAADEQLRTEVAGAM